jgi:sugar/nucleoside kinase (ribokinase family)
MKLDITGRKTPRQGLFVGLCTVDIAYVIEGFPGRNQKLTALSQELTAGGPATNAAITFSFLGGASSLTTAIGHHPLTSVIRRDLQKSCVHVQDIAPELVHAPPLSSIFVHAPTGERSVVSANAAAYSKLQYDTSSMALPDTQIVLVDGHHMPLCVAAAKAAHQVGVCVVFDGGSWKTGTSDLLPFIDVAICSEDFLPPGISASEEVMQYLSASGIRMIAITRGSQPIRWSSGNRRGEISIRSIQPKDTLGAGDIFHGAFCWAYVGGYEFPRALEFASEVATESCMYFGARTWMQSFDLQNIRSFLSSYNR